MTTEREFQAQVIEIARIYGWRLAHFRPGKSKGGRWSTPMTGDVGFPDLVLVRDRVVFAELKSDTGKPTSEQLDWLAAVRVAGAGGYLWRPADLDEIVRVLARRTATQTRAATA